MKERHTNIPASYLFLMRGDKVLLLQRANTGYGDGSYGVIAGHVDKGESFTDAMIREANEEAGILLDRDKIKIAHIQHKKSESDGSERVDAYFVATERNGEIQNKEPHKCSDLLWFPIDDLPENMID
jgi:8-oxo-dGTP pyrophosphatase MutT (NUDIX family)